MSCIIGLDHLLVPRAVWDASGLRGLAVDVGASRNAPIQMDHHSCSPPPAWGGVFPLSSGPLCHRRPTLRALAVGKSASFADPRPLGPAWQRVTPFSGTEGRPSHTAAPSVVPPHPRATPDDPPMPARQWAVPFMDYCAPPHGRLSRAARCRPIPEEAGPAKRVAEGVLSALRALFCQRSVLRQREQVHNGGFICLQGQRAQGHDQYVAFSCSR